MNFLVVKSWVRIMDNFKETNPKIVSDLIPDILTLGQVLKVLQNLLAEGVSIRDLRTIFERLAEYGTSIKDADSLTEHVRQSLYRTITETIRSEGEIFHSSLWIEELKNQ